MWNIIMILRERYGQSYSGEPFSLLTLLLSLHHPHLCPLPAPALQGSSLQFPDYPSVFVLYK